MIIKLNLMIAMLAVLSAGCVSSQRNGYTLNEWVIRGGTNPEFRAPIAPEALFIAKLTLDFKTRAGRWPNEEEMIDAGEEISGRIGEFVRKNVEVRSVGTNIEIVVWDLASRKNRLEIEANERIWIFREVYGTGSRQRMHATGSNPPDILEAILTNLGSSRGGH